MRRIALAGALAATLAAPYAAAGSHDRYADRDYRTGRTAASFDASAPAMLVRVQRLTGTGPDGGRHVLFEKPAGVLLPLDQVGRLGTMVDAREGRADGAYYNLEAELAPEFIIYSHGGGAVNSRFNADGRAIPFDVTGAVVVSRGSIRAVGLGPYYAAPGIRQAALDDRGLRPGGDRYRRLGDRGRDHDDDRYERRGRDDRIGERRDHDDDD
ncbi:MAG: hypothetical protein PHF72_04735 [Gammaproteobacteria bacterium]|nr:hypothetical protein [Gammaproteobacteria bacterium]